MYAIVMWQSVYLSVCPLQAGTVPKRLNTGSSKQRHMIAQGLYFSGAKYLGEIPKGSPPTGAPNGGGVENVQDMDIVTMEG